MIAVGIGVSVTMRNRYSLQKKMISVARNDDNVDFPSGGKADQHPQTLKLPGSQEQGIQPRFDRVW